MEILQCGHIHTYADPGILKKKLQGQIVCPLRNPRKIWNSWSNRMDTVQYSKKTDLQQFEHQWRVLERLDREYDIFYVPVDTRERDRVREITDVEFSWTKAGHMNGIKYEGKVPEVDWDFIEGLPMIERYYG